MKELRRFLRRKDSSLINHEQEYIEVNKQRGREIPLEPVTPLTEEAIKLLIEQYRIHSQRATIGSMEYFKWLHGWPVGMDTSGRREIDETAKAFQAADVLKNILTLLGQEKIL